jgi:hypothetical protein
MKGKFQQPTANIQKSSKRQDPMLIHRGRMSSFECHETASRGNQATAVQSTPELEAWSFSGIWLLEFGY